MQVQADHELVDPFGEGVKSDYFFVLMLSPVRPPAILPLESLSARSSSPLVFMLVVDWKNNVPDSVAVVYTIPYRRSSTHGMMGTDTLLECE